MLSLWNLYPLLLDFVVKVKVKAARLNATVIVVVEEKQQLGQDPTYSHLGKFPISNTLKSPRKINT